MADRVEREGMPEPGESSVGDRLHVCVGYTCNNNCLFCMEADRDARFQRLIAQTDDDVRRMMTADRGLREVMFTSGEPTLHPRLPVWIAMAKEIGFEIVGLITNGRRLAYRPYAEELLEAGLNHVLVSIHGPNGRVHDALTRTKGAFAQAVTGLANLAALKPRFPKLKVHTSYVVNRRNYQLFGEFYEAMRPLRVDQHVFNVMMPDGRGDEFFDTLMPRYSEIAEEFRKFVAALPPEGQSKVFLLDIPYCTTTRLPDPVRGYVERYYHFEPDGTVLFSQDGGSGVEPDEDGALFRKAAVEGEGQTYSKVAKSVHDAMVRGKRPECGLCGYHAICRGVFRTYTDHYGWDEFVPVNRQGRPVAGPASSGAGE